jgi:hypothetical protein
LCLCVDPTLKCFPHAKQGDTLGHFRNISIQRPKKASRLLFITTTTVGHWILDET